MRLESSILFACVSATAVLAMDQASELNVRHHAGQTFITYKEVSPPAVNPDATAKETYDQVKKYTDKTKSGYRIYRSDKPINSVDGMKWIGEAKPLGCWDWRRFGSDHKNKNQKAERFAIADGGAPLPVGTGLYVHNPDKEGFSHYAVTYVDEQGVENKSIGAGNSTADPAAETPGRGEPVVQYFEERREFNGVPNPKLILYVRWESPPNAPVENLPCGYIVGIPPHAPKPAPVGIALHCWGGSPWSGYGWWYSHLREGASYLIAPNQIPYDWWTGYNEKFWEGPPDETRWKQGKIKPYTTTRILSFLDWATEKYGLDPKRVHVNGSSMGGSGAPMFAIRYPDRIAWCISWVGVHDPGNTPQYTGGYESAFGRKKWDLEYEDGTKVWNYYNDCWYLRTHPEKDIGYIVFANGKNDIGIGWPQALDFLKALQETKQAHVFKWGMGDHGQRHSLPVTGFDSRIMPMDITIDRSLPAFTQCSLDDDPGTARKLDTPVVTPKGRKDIFDGASEGQINGHLYWKTDDMVDEPLAWEMTILLDKNAPRNDCTVNITPRRCQKFKCKAGETIRWSNRSLEGKELGSGKVVADKNGLVTVEKALIAKAGNRLVLGK